MEKMKWCAKSCHNCLFSVRRLKRADNSKETQEKGKSERAKDRPVCTHIIGWTRVRLGTFPCRKYAIYLDTGSAHIAFGVKLDPFSGFTWVFNFSREIHSFLSKWKIYYSIGNIVWDHVRNRDSSENKREMSQLSIDKIVCFIYLREFALRDASPLSRWLILLGVGGLWGGW